MTNHDFWMSISDIINEGFTSEGLAKLDDYAEQFSTGKILYKRFSPSEQLGCVKGGTIHVIASLLAGAEVGTDQLSAPEYSFKREQQLAKIQEKRIEDWAKNVLRTPDGHICVIDCDIRINIPELRTGGTRKLINKVEIIK